MRHALSVIAARCHCPGCGSQRLLRCRSHPAGRGPNSSSLFPPLAAVVAVAPKGEPLAGRVTSYWTPEVRYGAKGRALLQRAATSGQRTLSSCRCPGQRSTTAHETNKLCSFSGNLTDMPKPPLDRGGGCARGADGEVSSTAASKLNGKMINTKNYQMTSRNIF